MTLAEGIGSIQLILSYGFAAWVTAALLCRFSAFLGQRKKLALVIGLGLGPLLLGAVLNTLLWIAPGKGGWFYVAGTLGIMFGIGASGFRTARLQFQALAEMSRELISPIVHLNFLTPFAMVLWFLVIALLASAFFSPVTANDSLEYLQAARAVYLAADSSVYPPLDSGVTGGIYGPWSHPPAYVISLTWAYLLQGGAEGAGAAKLVAPYFAIASALLLMCVLGGPKKISGTLAAILLLTTPFYFSSAMQGSVDSLRIYPFTLSILSLVALVRQEQGSIPVAALAVAAALYTHSVGVLIIPMMIAIGVLYGGGELKGRLKVLGTCVALGVLLTSPFYFSNFLLYGAVVSDQPALWGLQFLQYDEYFRITRGLDTQYQRLMFGLLQGLTSYRLFGLSYLLLVLCVGHWLFRGILAFRGTSWRQLSSWGDGLSDIGRLSLLSLLIFYGGVVLSMMLGQDTLIKNARYILTMQPYVALFPALWIASLLGERSANG